MDTQPAQASAPAATRPSSARSARSASGVQPAAAPAARLPSPNEPEAEARQRLLAEAAHLRFERAAAAAEARESTLAVRSMRGSLSHADAMLDAFGLATPEGGALMRLSEALLRTPDRDS